MLQVIRCHVKYTEQCDCLSTSSAVVERRVCAELSGFTTLCVFIHGVLFGMSVV